ncbi:MAG: hypothetical protein R3B09_25285 [Nannocystaceae bacterium]
MSHARPRSPRRLVACLSLALGLSAAACKAKEPTRGPLDEDGARAKVQALQKRLAKDPKDVAAHRDLGGLYWMFLHESGEARRHFEAAAAGGDLVAMASLMVMANARLDHQGVRRWGEALVQRRASDGGEGEEGARRTALAAVAARFLDQDYGGEAGGEDEFIRFFDGLERVRLPATVSQPLLSRRAAIARIRDEDYQRYYDAEGCLRQWRAGVVEGTLAELELRRHDQPFVADPDDAAIAPLACAVRVWNPTPRAATRRIETALEVPGDRLVLELSAQQPFRAYVDGVLVHRTDRDDRWPERVARIGVPVTPGRHVFEIHVALPRDKAWVLARATTPAGAPIAGAAPKGDATSKPAAKGRSKEPSFRIGSYFGAGAPPGLDPQIYRPWALFFAAAEALANGDSDRAEVQVGDLIQAAPSFPEGQAISAVFEAEDPSRDRTASAAREQQALEEALALEPRLVGARIRLLEIALGRDEVAEVLEAIEALPPGDLDNVEGQILRFRAYLGRGAESLAEAALARALELQPRSCEALRYERQMAQQRGEVDREEALVGRAEHCQGMLTVRASLAQRRGRLDEARAYLRRALERTPDDLDLLQGLAAAEIAADDLAAAEALERRLLTYSPYSTRARIGLADLRGQGGAGEAARDEVNQALDRIPASSALHQIGRDIGVDDDLEALRVDGLPIARAYLEAPPAYEGAGEVLVLDRSAARIYADGSVRQIVHTIAEVRTKEAIDKYGEIVPPEDAKVLTLQSIKPDGAVIEPESIPGKDGLSLRGLAIGDLVEIEMIHDTAPSGYLPGYADLSTFRFQSFDVPFHVSELVVMHPSSMPILVESRTGAPAPTVERRGDRTIQRFRVERSPRRGVEPNHRALLDEVPSVRVYTAIDVEAWLGSLALRIYKAQRTNPELRRLAGRLTRGKARDVDRLVALWRWVVDKIEEGGDISASATVSLSARRGNRLMLLRALLREVGIRSEIWVARDRFDTPLIPGGHPLPESYEAPVLMVWLGESKEPVPVLTNSKVIPIGYLPTNLAGAPAMRLSLRDDEPRAAQVTMPQVAEHLQDRRRYDLRVDLDAKGEGTVTGKIALTGMEAAYWREGLRNLDRDRLEEAFERAELGVLFPGAAIDLEDLEIEHEKALQEPLILRFEGSIHNVGVSQGGDRAIRAALVPMNLGLGFAALPSRTTGLLIPYAPVQEAVVKVRWDGAAVRSLPKPMTVKTPYGSYVRAVDGSAGGDEITIRTRSTLTAGVVEPDDYPEFVELTREIRAAEDELVRVR